MNIDDTVIALATPEGRGAISVFRISGNNLQDLIGDVLPLGETEHGKIRKILLTDSSGNLIDEITFIKYVAPISYTGEDMVEIFSHGGVSNARRILEFFVSKGLRMAEPGEFTFRALLNEKITLNKAEAVDLICKSENIVELNSALDGISNKSNKQIERIYNRFREVYGDLIAEVEFIEEEVDLKRFLDPLNWLLNEVDTIILSYERVRESFEGVDVIVAGRSNVGKSSLFNRLLGEERSIVTDIEGTTRDIIDKKIYLGNIPVRFVDTAGLRITDDVVELIGQRKTKEEIDKATLIIYMVDVIGAINNIDEKLLSDKRDKIILVVNKIDLDPNFVLEAGFDRVFYVSAKYGNGIEELKNGIKNYILSRIDWNSKSLIFNKRQFDLFVNIKGYLKRAIDLIERGDVLDILLFELNNVKKDFEALLGKNIDEDIYKSIFSRFCVGK